MYLIDKPLICVLAKPWTAVTDDNHSISHLISIYFTWHYKTYPGVNKELFIKDIRGGNLNS